MPGAGFGHCGCRAAAHTLTRPRGQHACSPCACSLCSRQLRHRACCGAAPRWPAAAGRCGVLLLPRTGLRTLSHASDLACHCAWCATPGCKGTPHRFGVCAAAGRASPVVTKPHVEGADGGGHFSLRCGPLLVSAEVRHTIFRPSYHAKSLQVLLTPALLCGLFSCMCSLVSSCLGSSSINRIQSTNH